MATSRRFDMVRLQETRAPWKPTCRIWSPFNSLTFGELLHRLFSRYVVNTGNPWYVIHGGLMTVCSMEQSSLRGKASTCFYTALRK
jgi:hypothetical protein